MLLIGSQDWVSSLQHCRSGNRSACSFTEGPSHRNLTDCQRSRQIGAPGHFTFAGVKNAAFSEAERAACGFAPSRLRAVGV